MSRSLLRVLLPYLAASLLALPAAAATVQYSDSTSWTTAAGTPTTVNFNVPAVPAGNFRDYSNSTGYVNSGVDFIGYYAGTGYGLQVVDSTFGGGYFNFGSGVALRSAVYDRPTQPSVVPYIHVILPANTTALAAALGTVSPNGLTYQVTLSDGETFTIGTQTLPTTAFIGLVSNAPISYADFTVLGTQYNGGTYGLVKSFQFATSGASQAGPDTPEVCTLILIGTGLVAFRILKKRRLFVRLAHA